MTIEISVNGAVIGHTTRFSCILSCSWFAVCVKIRFTVWLVSGYACVPICTTVFFWHGTLCISMCLYSTAAVLSAIVVPFFKTFSV